MWSRQPPSNSSQGTTSLLAEPEAVSSCAGIWTQSSAGSGVERRLSEDGENITETRGTCSGEHVEAEQLSKGEVIFCTCKGGACKGQSGERDRRALSALCRRREGCACKQLRNIFVASLYDGGIIAAAIPPSHRLPFVLKPLRIPRSHRTSGIREPVFSELCRGEGKGHGSSQHTKDERSTIGDTHSKSKYSHGREDKGDKLPRETQRRGRSSVERNKAGRLFRGRGRRRRVGGVTARRRANCRRGVCVSV
ncbi:transmembrane surface antigen tsa1 [Cystoisospora suis]|uniref:Transmembrane surface antigen tsa1 n=1 Tax=Cystoisospora suis TaxID=483139 RepID=A0A2C6KJU2_9APIC|nr:transmembrane surface antigen tsa1 [Cystoisospora suis]